MARLSLTARPSVDRQGVQAEVRQRVWPGVRERGERERIAEGKGREERAAGRQVDSRVWRWRRWCVEVRAWMAGAMLRHEEGAGWLFVTPGQRMERNS